MCLFSLRTVKQPQFNFDSIQARLESFDDWTSEFDHRELVYEGFFLTEKDIVECFNCHLKLYHLQTKHQDTVDILHRQYSPHCPLVNRDVCGRLPMWRIHFDLQ